MFADDEVRFVVGVDPHAECHAVVVVDGATRRTRSVITIPATRRGYQAALAKCSQSWELWAWFYYRVRGFYRAKKEAS